MITIAQAKKLRHGQTVYVKGKYNADGTPMRVRVTGKIQLWKTRPKDFKVPVKHGLYDSGYINPASASLFTLKEPASKKPAKKKPWTPRTPRPYYPQYGIR